MYWKLLLLLLFLYYTNITMWINYACISLDVSIFPSMPISSWVSLMYLLMCPYIYFQVRTWWPGQHQLTDLYSLYNWFFSFRCWCIMVIIFFFCFSIDLFTGRSSATSFAMANSVIDKANAKLKRSQKDPLAGGSTVSSTETDKWWCHYTV